MPRRIILIITGVLLAYVLGVRTGRKSARPEPLRIQAERVFRHRRRRRARARAARKTQKAAAKASRALKHHR